MGTHLKNVTLLAAGASARFGMDILVGEDGRIAQIGPQLVTAVGDHVMNAKGALCLPGFVNGPIGRFLRRITLSENFYTATTPKSGNRRER